jgi:prephenate dehydrogenase
VALASTVTKPSLAILAPGLLGGSAAMAARASGAASRIFLWARRPEVRHALREQPWCDEVCDSPETAVKDADLVIIAAPVDRIVPLSRQIAGHLRAGAVVTDVGSVKGEISRLGHAAMGSGAQFVGSHPMAGSEKTGWEHGSPRLFDRRTCFVTPLAETNAEAVERVVGFWREIGGEPVTVSPDEHDEIVAHISHLPQVLASNLCALLHHKNPVWRNYAGGGLRDTTRIAASNPALWRTILEQNRDEVLRAITAYEDELHAFKTALANRDYPELITRMELAREYRSRFRP